VEGQQLRRLRPEQVNSINTQVTSVLQSKIKPLQVSQAIKKDGAVVFPKLLDSHLISILNKEFDEAFNHSSRCVSTDEHPPGKAVTITTQLLEADQFPAIASLFLNSIFEDIADEVLPTNSTFHDRIALTHEFQPTAITDIHFDMKRSLKSLLYLVDTDQTNGAFSFATETHVENSAYRRSFLDQGGQLRDLLNIASESESIPLRTVCAPAGTLIIFDADVFHQGGTLQPGKERKVIRGRSLFGGQPDSSRHTWCSRSWWRYRMNPPETPTDYYGRRSSRGRSRAA
jgi:hypothetical protein